MKYVTKKIKDELDLSEDKVSSVTQEEFGKLIPGYSEIIQLMHSSYDDLQSARKLYDVINKAYYNVFPDSSEMEYTNKSVDILKSGFCHSSVEISSRGLRFPTFRVEASTKVGIKQLNAQEGSKALLEWLIKESGFQNVYTKSKESWAKYGDAYRRPYARPIKGKEGKYWPQYEILDPYYILLDPDATQVWSHNTADSGMYYGYTQILDTRQIIKLYGEDILDHIQPGALIDVDTYTEKAGKQKQTNYYERLEITDQAYGNRFILLGQTGFPKYVCLNGKERPNFPKEVDDFIEFSSIFKTKNKLGEEELDVTNVYFFHDSRGPRNLGIVHKLIPSQQNEETIENLKSEATRLKMLEIPTIAGGKEQVVDDSVSNFIERRKESLLSFLHAPSNIEGVIPKFDILRFQGVSAEDASQTTRDIYNFARNTTGVDLSRLQVQSNVTLGQSQLIEQEKVDTLATIILQNKDIIEREYRILLDHGINHEGYGLDDIMLSYDYIKEIEGITPESEPSRVTTKREISVKDLAIELKDERLSIIIDDSELINRTYTTMMDSWIRLLGIINPAEAPELYKFILKKVGESGRFDIPDSVMKGAKKQTQAMGGASQFQSSNPSQSINNEQSNEQDTSESSGLPSELRRGV